METGQGWGWASLPPGDSSRWTLLHPATSCRSGSSSFPKNPTQHFFARVQGSPLHPQSHRLPARRAVGAPKGHRVTSNHIQVPVVSSFVATGRKGCSVISPPLAPVLLSAASRAPQGCFHVARAASKQCHRTEIKAPLAPGGSLLASDLSSFPKACSTAS